MSYAHTLCTECSRKKNNILSNHCLVKYNVASHNVNLHSYQSSHKRNNGHCNPLFTFFAFLFSEHPLSEVPLYL